MDQRIEFAMKALTTDNFSELCKAYGISRRVGYKWRERFVAEGISGMQEQSRRPNRRIKKSSQRIIIVMLFPPI